ncbi:hypothetical protein EDEG_03417 [Edhazardia aedis USNM 41457]|uniref:ATP-dependent RNA helicase n=1 Tax=Edhazardia aedis (strain USNM 41457) TaxID=1003232 RepID=J9D2V4_EDHAE|nr:hypothetical protein EDEG_03417 [Edhazardia aedis USNM 41457]|eukprot:EJW02136.1 hypothetical protein EDEG_03417 [Edhazardia aedis USNM 41457]
MTEKTFEDFNLDARIIKGLKGKKYTIPTQVQLKTLPHALSNESIIATSKTGSGKTLAFLIPILQKLLKLNWQKEDGLGALILTPTRELAIQIYEVLKDLTQFMNMNCGTIIGGTQKHILEKEKRMISSLSVIVATPGRMLQHLEESYGLNASNLEILVLDEADKMVEMGFKQDIEQIVRFLNDERQTLLFSATPNFLIDKIDCLNLQNYKIISENDSSENVPAKLVQIYYQFGSIGQKINCLNECLKKNLNKRIIVFFATCKAVKFYNQLFLKIFKRNKNRFYILNGGMKQDKRIDTFKKFQTDKNGILFCTDLGSRGLDFQNISLVVQFDCPDTVETYFHRVGRTARNEENGTSVIYLLDPEIKIIDHIRKGKPFSFDKNNKNKEIENINIEKKSRSPKDDIHNNVLDVLKNDNELQNAAEKYLSSYQKFCKFGCKKYFENHERIINDAFKYFKICDENSVDE